MNPDDITGLITLYSEFAFEWMHPSGRRLDSHPRDPAVVERWCAYLRTLPEAVESSPALEHALAGLCELLLDPERQNLARHATGAYLWEIARRGERELYVPRAMRALKPAYRVFLEPFFTILGP